MLIREKLLNPEHWIYPWNDFGEYGISILYIYSPQIFFCFYDLSNITYLLNALQHISSWMTANLLTLNTSKTEFLLIGLKQQLAKIQNSTLNTIIPLTLLVT